MITEENSKHLLTSDEKIKYWGYGEWVEEPDEVFFTHNDNVKIWQIN